ncbi:hypothetical protein WJ50_10800 [Burkholderia ubonensis]|nr:hypothetical protein WJ48_01595 [Burkholderia ubonensis]KVL76349.1 hypothetical protein WJ49_11655 [Burkholderia ubonensis]KVL92094.1 hypothetical protein WJ50_10800 [Burkholderia ubonensis]
MADSAPSVGQRVGHYVAAHVFEASALALTLVTGLAYVVGRSYLNGWEEAAGVPGLMFRRDLSDVMLGGRYRGACLDDAGAVGGGAVFDYVDHGDGA